MGNSAVSQPQVPQVRVRFRNLGPKAVPQPVTAVSRVFAVLSVHCQPKSRSVNINTGIKLSLLEAIQTCVYFFWVLIDSFKKIKCLFLVPKPAIWKFLMKFARRLRAVSSRAPEAASSPGARISRNITCAATVTRKAQESRLNKENADIVSQEIEEAKKIKRDTTARLKELNAKKVKMTKAKSKI